MEVAVGAKQHQPPHPPQMRNGHGRGTIQHTYPERGFGFIRCTDGAPGDVGQDFFFHATSLLDGVTLRELLPGTRVEFECHEVPRGKRAEAVQLV